MTSQFHKRVHDFEHAEHRGLKFLAHLSEVFIDERFRGMRQLRFGALYLQRRAGIKIDKKMLDAAMNLHSFKYLMALFDVKVEVLPTDELLITRGDISHMSDNELVVLCNVMHLISLTTKHIFTFSFIERNNEQLYITQNVENALLQLGINVVPLKSIEGDRSRARLFKLPWNNDMKTTNGDYVTHNTYTVDYT